MVATIYILGCSSFLFLLYGPYDNFRTWLISTAMSTMNHQYLCKWFYNDKEIDKVINSNYIVEVNEETDTDLIDMKTEKYDNEYEEKILKRDKDDKYKIIELKVNGQKAYLAAIYDPALVKVAVTKNLGRQGQYVTKMAEDNNALLAVNGGGFYDPGNNSTGGMPTGVTISNGKIKTDNNYSSYTQSGGLIGMTNDNKLVFKTFDKAIALNPCAKPIFHLDRGFQYTSKMFKKKLVKQEMRQSMSRVGHCIDNGPTEGFWGIIKAEMYQMYEITDESSLRFAIKDYIRFYSEERPQDRYCCKTPLEVRQEALKSDIPVEYPIPENKRIKKYKEKWCA